MSEWRRSKMLGKRDESEPEIIEAFLEGKASVIKHSGVNESDLVVGYKGRNHLVENKTGNAPLTPGQKKWAESWGGEKPVVCRNAAQARKLLRKWDQEFAEAAAKRNDIVDDLAALGSGR